MRPWRDARPALLGITILLAALGTACGKDLRPIFNPLDDRNASPTMVPGTQNFPPPFPPPSVTPIPSLAPTSAPELEDAAAQAIDALSARTGFAVSRFSVVSVQAVNWPDSCLGVSVPGLTCSQVITPGYKVVLHLDSGSTHEVHTGRNGAAAWAPQQTVHATVATPGQTLTLTKSDGTKVSALVAPGTQLVDVTLASLKTGDRVVLGVDDLGDGSPLRVAWLARDQ